MKKDLLIITSYFPPEIGAASNRIFALAQGLSSFDKKVTVLTPLPNYPHGKIFKEYRGSFSKKESIEKLSVHRLWIYASNSKNKLSRFLSMISYSISLTWYFIRKPIPNKVIIQSPPLIVAFTCMIFLKKKNRKLILNVSDLWPIAGLELGAFKENFTYKTLQKIERFNYKRANLILGQSNEILEHVTKIASKTPVFLYRNLPQNLPILNEKKLDNSAKIKLVYAGLLGVAQGILKLVKNLDYSNIELHIYGSGAEEEEISSYLIQNSQLPVSFYGSIPRLDLIKKMDEYDIAIVPLLTRIYGSVPSKIFELAHLGMPILYFGGGEGAEIVDQYKLGWTVNPGDYNSLNKVILHLNSNKLSDVSRNKLREIASKEFNFANQLALLNRII
ncbi:MAG: glycosyltransferase family 4 protein [bacterium]